MIPYCLKQLVLLSRSSYFPCVVISCVFYVLCKCKLILKEKKLQIKHSLPVRVRPVFMSDAQEDNHFGQIGFYSNRKRESEFSKGSINTLTTS